MGRVKKGTKIGKRIRGFRKAAGLSLERLSELIDVTYQQLQKYESGESRVSAERLEQIAKALRIDVKAFFKEEDGERVTEKATPYHIPEPLSPEEKRLLTYFRSIPNRSYRSSLLTIIRHTARFSEGKS